MYIVVILSDYSLLEFLKVTTKPMVLTLEDSDENNAYYNVSARPDYISEFEEKYHLADITYYNSHLFKITWFGDNPPLGI